MTITEADRMAARKLEGDTLPVGPQCVEEITRHFAAHRERHADPAYPVMLAQISDLCAAVDPSTANDTAFVAVGKVIERIKQLELEREAVRLWVRGEIPELGKPKLAEKQSCAHCGDFIFGEREDIIAHVASCPSNPLVVELASLREKVAELEQQLKGGSP